VRRLVIDAITKKKLEHAKQSLMQVSSAQETGRAEPTETTGDMAETADDRISKWFNNRKCLKHAVCFF